MVISTDNYSVIKSIVVNKTQAPVASVTKQNIPTVEELTYRIYDEQRDIITSIEPKRFETLSPVTLKAMMRTAGYVPEKNIKFDGMSYMTAIEHFSPICYSNGIADIKIGPYLFANRIELWHASFKDAPCVIFENKDGMRYITQNCEAQFLLLTNSRFIISNLSFRLDLEYKCNLHLSQYDINSAFSLTGVNRGTGNRSLFDRACRLYVEPTQLPYHDFIRCQVKEVRHKTNQAIDELFRDPSKLSSFLYDELNQAHLIYSGVVHNYVGDLTESDPVSAFE